MPALSVRLLQAAPIPLDVDFRCEAGELLALVGPSGSGKTTILRVISGLARCSQGRVAVGDEVLKAFAQATLKALRAEDRLGRFGGEEFVLVMPNLDITTAPAVFERIRKAVHRLEAPGWPVDRPLTVSMGATAARDTDPDLDWIIKRADEALYRAKNNGRDRLETA